MQKEYTTTLTRLSNEAKAMLEFINNPNKPADQKLLYIQRMLLSYMIYGMDETFKIYRQYTPLKTFTPMYDELNATRLDLIKLRNSL